MLPGCSCITYVRDNQSNAEARLIFAIDGGKNFKDEPWMGLVDQANFNFLQPGNIDYLYQTSSLECRSEI